MNLHSRCRVQPVVCPASPVLQQRWHQARRGHDRVDQNRIMACLQPFVNIGHAGTAKDDGRGGGGGLNVRDMARDHGSGPFRIMFEVKNRHTACQNGDADIAESLLFDILLNDGDGNSKRGQDVERPAAQRGKVKGGLANANDRLSRHGARVGKPGIIKTSKDDAVTIIMCRHRRQKPGRGSVPPILGSSGALIPSQPPSHPAFQASRPPSSKDLGAGGRGVAFR